MSSMSLDSLPPEVAARLLAGETVAIKKGRRVVARLSPAGTMVERVASRRLSVDEWISEYADTGPSVPGAVAAFIRERD
jgi:hypothetical protein